MPVDSGLLTISQVAARLPGTRGAGRVHPATVTRWILVGCPARDRRRVKLAAIRAGSRWLIRDTDLQAFFAALAADAPPGPPDKPDRTSTERRKAVDRATQDLTRMGA
ncbi:MerR family transcriptional regulator [Limnoglobus roseus]|uniref:DNA-binding protein n=1 Tax=Limnoglobus roseus TaxID=2598579 RepID=A0A5C1AMH1_9BACT|nr:hypothetical protein [Limnoglobus roseus]QEL19166.1 DNA-binding protein [Limnoglobus roseus]